MTGSRRPPDRLGQLAVVILVILLILTLFGHLIAPYEPNAQNLTERLRPPPWWWDGEAGSWKNPLGTDQLGRDILSRLIVGTALTLLVGFAAAALELLIGGTLGVVAGMRGGRADAFIMRAVDVQMGFPTVLMILLVVLVFGSGPYILVIALAVNGWMFFTRLVRQEVRRVSGESYFEAARLTGMRRVSLFFRHGLPQIRGYILNLYLMEVPKVILAAAALSYLGIGVTPPHVSWGLMIGDGQSVITVAAYPSLFPGFAIVITITALYLFALWIEARIDPQRVRNVDRGQVRAMNRRRHGRQD